MEKGELSVSPIDFKLTRSTETLVKVTLPKRFPFK